MGRHFGSRFGIVIESQSPRNGFQNGFRNDFRNRKPFRNLIESAPRPLPIRIKSWPLHSLFAAYRKTTFRSFLSAQSVTETVTIIVITSSSVFERTTPRESIVLVALNNRHALPPVWFEHHRFKSPDCLCTSSCFTSLQGSGSHSRVLSWGS